MLVNAAHAIEARGPGQPGRIVVATRQAGDAVEIRITDNGSGMSEDVRARVFDPFFTTKEVGQGTGQGLAIAHSVVKKHQGSIVVDSEPGRGTCFTIRLPLAAVHGSGGNQHPELLGDHGSTGFGSGRAARPGAAARAGSA